MSDLAAVLERLEANEQGALSRLFSFIAVESVSTDPAFDSDCLAAAHMAKGFLEEAGFEAEVAPTTGHPMVLGRYRSQANAEGPHLLFYGHYDVQPVDPIDEWTRPPFKAEIVETDANGAIIHGRGSSDDKGQLLTFLEAARAWHEVTGDLPVNVTVLLEGEEECGSPSLDGFLEARGDELKSDFAVICDTLQWDKDTPAVTAMLRGLAGVEITITGPSRDLHSGMYGGPALNPLRAMSVVLASLHDEAGRVAVPGFYDGVEEPPSELATQWRDVGFDEAAFLADIGLTRSHGERDYHLLEQLWCRPTVEINGMWGGYIGPGRKTVIPSSAHAKLSFRLVAGQDPAKILAAVEGHLRAACAAIDKDVKLDFIEPVGSPAVAFDLSKGHMDVARQCLEDEWGRVPVMLGCGGSIPIVELFESRLGMDCLLVGFALNDDCIHAPDEKYNVKSFQKGARSFARMIGGFAGM